MRVGRALFVAVLVVFEVLVGLLFVLNGIESRGRVHVRGRSDVLESSNGPS